MAEAQKQDFVIPARPDVLLQLAELVKQGDPGIERVAGLVKRDVALYANILALINSPFFGLRGRVTSVDRAVRMMGIRRMSMLVRLASLRSSLSDDTHLEPFWEDACEVATICAHLTAYMPFTDRDEAFTLGMMHACAVPLMVQNFDGYQRFYEEACLLDLEDQQRLEQQMYGHNHFDLSSQLAQNWQMPELMCQAIALQPAYAEFLLDENSDPATCRMLCLLLIGRDFSLKFETLWGRADEYQPVIVLEPVLQYLGITEEELDRIQQHLFSQLQVDDRGIVPDTA